MHTRREFIAKAAQMAGAAGVLSGCPESIVRALAIEPAAGSSYLDAEHVVILMQENRSFDHTFGTLRGVRGFNDPRAITLPDGNPVWVQPNRAGERYVPFRLDIKDTKATWMGSLPHGWTDQQDARNHGRYDRWLSAKRSGHRDYAAMPLTLGYYTRADIPFYYALADAFTICDQHFCSSLTGTTPNRLHLWTGTIRERQSASAPANVRNENVDYGNYVSWTTFPERLEDHGISWKIYQNELSLESGLSDAEDAWLTNFSDNPIEWFTQFHVRFAASHLAYRDKRIGEIPGEITALKKQLGSKAGSAEKTASVEKRIANLTATLKRFEAERKEWTREKFDRLSPRAKSLHARAFSTNADDPAYRQLAEISYRDGRVQRHVKVPKGDVLHQFREDVKSGTLPTVSWIVSPQEFSDHPSSAWYGAWYLSEVLDILTHNPEVWKKTIFILTYDENDGYFDHVPPFVVPHPRRPETGRVTKGIDASVEYVELEQDRKRASVASAREGSIGLGYRVPLIVASPWSRGGVVCSQVFDHTSVLQFLETLLTHKTGKKVEESNISRWRRAVCGDLTSLFAPAAEKDKGSELKFLQRDAFVEEIHRAQFKGLPRGYHVLTKEEIESIRRHSRGSPLLPHQEAGVRPSAALPYQLMVDGAFAADRTRFTIRFEARKEIFGKRSAGSPFVVYALGGTGALAIRNYAVEAGERLEDSWEIDGASGAYHFRVYGPNGFFREFIGDKNAPALDIHLDYARARPSDHTLTGGIDIFAANKDGKRSCTIEVRDNAYKNTVLTRVVEPAGSATLSAATQSSAGWYDVSVRIANQPKFEKRYAGRVETGKWSVSDPAMGADDRA